MSSSVFKRTAAWLAHHLWWWQLVAMLCRWNEGRPLLAAFTFHRVLEEPPLETYLQGYERGQSISSFVIQLEAIRRLFDVCSLREFTDLAMGRKQAGPRPVALLTFDDADSLHGRLPFAALFERGLPAVSFVPTAFIESDRRFYHLRLTNICNHLSASNWRQLMNDQVPAEVRSVLQEFLESTGMDQSTLRHRLIPAFHTMNVEARDSLLDQWERFAPDYTLGIECAGWDEIRSWKDRGIEIGSHTVNHHRLSLLEPNSIEAELKLSREVLRRELSGEVISVSYPEGSVTDAVPALAERAGYEVGFTTRPGFVMAPLSESGRFLIPRISISGDAPYLASYSIGRLMLRHLITSVKRRMGKGPSSETRLPDQPR